MPASIDPLAKNVDVDEDEIYHDGSGFRTVVLNIGFELKNKDTLL
jgi:hypothetical protein